MVSTVMPSAWTASTLQDFTQRPLRSTVQAPQLLVSQPITVPVFPSFSRRYCTRSILGSTSSATFSPSTVRLIRVMGSPWRFAREYAATHVVLVTLGARGWSRVGARPPTRRYSLRVTTGRHRVAP